MSKVDLRPYGLFWDLDPSTMSSPVPEAYKIAQADFNNNNIYIKDEFGNIKMRIELKEEIGKGAYGHTYSTNLKINGDEAVVKIIGRNQEYTTVDVATEVIMQILVVNATADFVDKSRNLQGPFAPKVYMFAKDERFYYIVNERMKVDFRTILKIDSSYNFRIGIAQICVALKVLYDKLQFNHRDFKPDNIMFSFNGMVRVIDFGFSCLTYGDMYISSGYPFPKKVLHHCDKKSRDMNSLFFYLLNYSKYKNVVCPYKRIIRALIYNKAGDPVNWPSTYGAYNGRPELVNLFPENILKVFEKLEFHSSRFCSDFNPNWVSNIEEINTGVIGNLNNEELAFLNTQKMIAFLTDVQSTYLTKRILRSVTDTELKDFCYALLKELNKTEEGGGKKSRKVKRRYNRSLKK
jgi:serine/threonine protein kinase